MDSIKKMRQGRSIKGGKVRESHMEQLLLDPPLDSADDDIKAAFRELVLPDNPPQQVGAVEKLLAASKKNEECAKICTRILVSALMQLPSKAQLRTKISKFVTTIASAYPEIYEETLVEVICNALTSLESPVTIMQAVTLVVEDGSTVFSFQRERIDVDTTESQEFKVQDLIKPIILKIHPFIFQGMLNGITQLWCKHYKEASSSLEATQVLQHVQQLVKNSTAYLQHHGRDLNVETSKEIHLLLEVVLGVIQHPSCPLDLRINCGQLIAIIHKLQTTSGLPLLVENVISEGGQYAYLIPLAQLALVNGVLCISPAKELYSEPSSSDVYLGVKVLQAVLSPTFQTNEGNMAISAIRTVQHWTLRTVEAVKSTENLENLMFHLHPDSPLMSSLLAYLWLSWDHFLDSVKHAAKETFQNLIRIHAFLSLEDSKAFYTELSKTLLMQPLSRKYKLSAISCMVPVVGSQTLLIHDPQLPTFLLILMKDSSMASQAAELLEALFSLHVREVSQEDWVNVWLTAFLSSFSKEMQTFGFELLFKKLLFTCPESLDVAVSTLLESVEDLVSEKLCLLIMCIKTGRLSIYWQEKCQEKNAENAANMWKYILPYKTIQLCLGHIDESVRTAAFSLLCESPKSTELPEKQEMDLVLDYYIYNITNQSPSYKQHLLKSTKKLFLRINEGVRILQKSKKNNENYVIIINDLNVFCKNLFLLMTQNLHSGANMSRRGTSLQILELFNEILSPDCWRVFSLDELSHNQTYVDSLLCILDDSYENNKLIAMRLLIALPHRKTETHDEKKIQCLVNAACDLASSCRPPDSLTASYVLRFLLNDPLALKVFLSKVSDDKQSQNSLEVFFEYLLGSLQLELKVAQSSLIKAAASGPLYGLLLCVRSLISDIPKDYLRDNHDKWKGLIRQVTEICYEVSELVAPVVRNSSPEGHLPMDLNPESLADLRAVLQASLGNQQLQNDVLLSLESKPDELVKAQAVSSQMLLLCAWRSVKEVSLMLGDLVQKFPLHPDPISVLSVEDIRKIGQYFLTQLSETKHRGAFEQSYVGFSRICERLWQCSDEELRKLPEEWLTEVLRAIQDDGDDRLCATRRSAGVPFIIQAVLSSEPSVRGAACLKSTMTSLLTLAEEPQFNGSDARIHAFNILRAVYRETRLGDLIVPYAPRGVKAAIRGYKSNSWAERNSAALLFASLITRMFGVKRTQDDLSRKNAMSALVFFRRYPELYDFLKRELEDGATGVKEGKTVPALFPALLVLARLAPSPVEGRSSALSLATFTPAVIQCTSSSVLHIRGLASHALVPLVTPDNVPDVVKQLCEGVSLTNQNSLHGSLLCLLKLMHCNDDIFKDDKSNTIKNSIMAISWSATKANPCFITRSCAIELFTSLITNRIISDVPLSLHKIFSDAVALVTSKDSAISYKPWTALCQKDAAQYILHFAEIAKLNLTAQICLLLDNSSYEVRLLCLNYLENVEKLSHDVFKKLLDMIEYKELHNDCLVWCYRILNRFIASKKNEILCKALVKHFINRAQEETCIELITEMLSFSSSVVTALLVMEPKVNFEDDFNQWLKMIMDYIGSENDSDTRIQAAYAISSILPFIFIHPGISDNARLVIYEALITQLQDDNDMVRDIVANSAGKSLTCDEVQKSRQCSRVVETVCNVIAAMGTSDALSLLVKLALKEDLPEGFGLTQDDDRVFDKGEMNSYREERIITNAAVKSLAIALNSWPKEESPPQFIKHDIVPYLCAVPEKQNYKDELEDYLSLSTLAKLLEEDIYLIYSHISSLENTAVYCVKNAELWLVRLGCRSSLWKALLQHTHIQSNLIQFVVSSLKESVMKGSYLINIIDDLS